MSVDSVKGKLFLLSTDSLILGRARRSEILLSLSDCDEIRESIQKIASKVFTGSSARIHFFGSRVIGLATDDSDLDIYVEIDNGFSSTYSVNSSHDIRLTKLSNALQCESGWTVQKTILRTSVPIIICDFKRPYSSNSKISCDINIKNGVSVRNSELICHLFKLQPEAVKLFHFIREWMKDQQLKIVKGYTLTLLVVFYLQSKKLMPKVRDLQMGVFKEKIDGCDVHFNRDSTLFFFGVTKISDYKQHVRGFFTFYSSFDFSRVISTFDGETYSEHVYKHLYLKFFTQKGILIAGPCTRGNNCGVMDNDDKEQLINFLKESKNFFDIHL